MENYDMFDIYNGTTLYLSRNEETHVAQLIFRGNGYELYIPAHDGCKPVQIVSAQHYGADTKPVKQTKRGIKIRRGHLELIRPLQPGTYIKVEYRYVTEQSTPSG
jgi:hypothetical protein